MGESAIRVLIVDDDSVLARSLQRVLSLQGFDVDLAHDGRSALAQLENDDYDVMLLDLRMGSMDGMEVYAKRPSHSSPATIVHSAHIDVKTAVTATRAGVHDVMQKPVPEDVLTARIRELALERRAARGRPRPELGPAASRAALSRLVGTSAKTVELRENVRRVAHFRDVSVLVHGPTGTGKELVAQAIHALTCPEEPFVSVNCAAIPEQLFESELFGHESGAFTSARSTHVGLFEEAAGGTLFLDEIGEMPLPLQAKLLRVLEIRQFRRVGGTRTRVFAARVVSATNRPLTPSLGGAVRPDLFFRLTGYAIRTPSLAERAGDVPELARHFLSEFERRHGVAPSAFSADAMNALVAHDWPGNVRELRAVVENATMLARGERIERHDVASALESRGSARMEAAERWEEPSPAPSTLIPEAPRSGPHPMSAPSAALGPRRAPSLPEVQRDLIQVRISMAVIDETKNVLVVRIVYDGPALSGKTTSLRALARGVSSRVESPAELAGRTLFFDWVDYVGGLFDGRQIRCQIVSVPGQRDLSLRRKFILETADAAVVVLDTRRHELDFGVQWLSDTAPLCRAQDPPIGLLVQANKRDAAEAVPDDVLRTSLARVAHVAVVPSAATTGDGIRETFVLAVRMALDRVRALAAAGRLLVGKPPEDVPDELLDRMKRQERPAEIAVEEGVSRALARVLERERDRTPADSVRPPESRPGAHAELDDEQPFVPDPMMPGGMIWPPVDGRTLLHEVASLDIRPRRTGRSDWAGSGSGFRFHSHGAAIFTELASARHELLEWARLHSASLAYLSTGRAVILADAGGGRLRLWQLVRSEATLRERFAAALPLQDPRKVAQELWAVALQLVAAREFFEAATVSLPCTLWTIGANVTHRPLFVGLMPSRGSQLPVEPSGRELLLRELSPQLRELRRSRVDYSEIVNGVAALADLAAPGTPGHWLAEIVEET